MQHRKSGLSSNGILCYLAPVKSFYAINDISKKALDFYLDLRSRYGEKLKDESPLIREQFDLRNPGKPKIFNK